MCPHCRAFITNKDRICPYCNEKVGARAVDRRDPGALLGGLIPHARFATTLLLTVNVAMYLMTVIYSMRSGNSSAFMNIDVRTLVYFGAIFPPALRLGQWWRLVTAGYLHGGLLHIGMNMWVLTIVSAQVEEIYGAARMFVFYAIASVCGFYLSSVIIGTISVGASAGLTGLIGVMIAFGIHHRSAIGDAIKKQYLIWIGYILVSGFIISGVDNAAHVGGLAGGFALAYLTGAPGYRDEARETYWKAAALICILGTAFCFYKMYLSFSSFTQ